MKDGQKVKFDYKLARVEKVHPGSDGKVRHVTLEYKNHTPGITLQQTPFMKTDRSVHNIAVIT